MFKTLSVDVTNLLYAEGRAEARSLEGGTEYSSLIGVDVGSDLGFGCELLKAVLDEGSQASGLERVLDGHVDPGSEIRGELLESGARELVAEIDIFVKTLEECRRLAVGAQNLTDALGLLEQLRSRASMALDLLGGDGCALRTREGNEGGDNVVDNERVESVTSKGLVPANTKNLNLLDGLVALADVLDAPASELENGGRG
ncbi:hypothetical protein HBI56_158730 [Parastagonospora nodorum]|nr:hypothetical protein HBH56_189450 [Parastagonospora nodorum]KAH3925102.1 hypothetical protein HBH54_185260 [Parastagonospora nodorum]KAH3963777.1 hypothetical protein HBH51_164450 [Parastagonospora nodorum]KAH3967956.1 hypothetical protein HBH52_183840 [Parastagonospora nodorum]KAH3994667.1 hypothetical protein HBI10_183480 [Parastagonospora nodorum]